MNKTKLVKTIFKIAESTDFEEKIKKKLENDKKKKRNAYTP